MISENTPRFPTLDSLSQQRRSQRVEQTANEGATMDRATVDPTATPADTPAHTPTDTPTDRAGQDTGIGTHRVPLGTDLSRGAAIAFELELDRHGRYVATGTESSLQSVVEMFSRMKYGDLDAVAFFAGHLAAEAMRDPRFLEFCERAASAGRFVYIVSTAMYNVPSASNLLARRAADYLNVGLATRGLPPVVNAEQTRLTESPLGYARQTLRERADAPADGSSGAITIVPENFRGQSVVFVDDVFNSGLTASRTAARMAAVEVADLFLLLAVRVDPLTVDASDGTIEFALNNAVVDGSLESIAPMLRAGNFAVVQKLMKITLDPSITAQLPRYLEQIPTESILKLYFAATNNDYRRRYERQFSPSLAVYERTLQQRGALDAAGHVVPPARPGSSRPIEPTDRAD